MYVLICNAGSTSLKFKLYDMPSESVLARGHIERVGSRDDAVFKYYAGGYSLELGGQDVPDYETGIRRFLTCLTRGEGAVISGAGEIARVGYKATLSKGHYGVHELTDEVLDGMAEWISLAPLHNRVYLDVIRAMREVIPGARSVGAFETAFHRTIPLERRIFGLPYEWYEKYGVERLGYHGASHGHVADVLNAERERYRAISCHLGGSCSVCAIEDGRSVDTSFGMSLESGLIHANRVGDLDPGMIWFLRGQGLSDGEIREGFTKTGGLLGISGVSNDLRYVLDAAREGNERAELAARVFVTGIVRYIGAFYLELGGLDYLVFTAGIGENSAEIRRRVCERLAPIGVELDAKANERTRGEGIISAPESAVTVRVIPADEELSIARRAYELE